jgi:hypothetical protein
MFRAQNAVEKAAMLQLVRERVDLLRYLSGIKCLKSEAQAASCDVNLQRLLVAERNAALTRVVRFDTDHPEIADLFVYRRRTTRAPAEAL